MIEIYCVIEDPAEDDFVCLLKKDARGRWGGIELAESAVPEPAVEKAVGANVSHVWPLCDRVQEAPPPEETGDRRAPGRRSRTHLGAVLTADALALADGEWAVVPFDDAFAMVDESERRVLGLARQGAWIHKVSRYEA